MQGYVCLFSLWPPATNPVPSECLVILGTCFSKSLCLSSLFLRASPPWGGGWMSGGEKTLAKEQEAWAGDTEEAWVTVLR